MVHIVGRAVLWAAGQSGRSLPRAVWGSSLAAGRSLAGPFSGPRAAVFKFGPQGGHMGLGFSGPRAAMFEWEPPWPEGGQGNQNCGQSPLPVFPRVADLTS